MSYCKEEVKRKDLDGDPNYKIAKDGSIYCVNIKRNLLPFTASNGFQRVYINGTPQYVHILVAREFLKPVMGLMFVKFIDGDKSNVNSSNLEWATLSETRKK